MTPLAALLTENQQPERSEDSDSQVGADDLFFPSSGGCVIDNRAGREHREVKQFPQTRRYDQLNVRTAAKIRVLTYTQSRSMSPFPKWPG